MRYTILLAAIVTAGSLASSGCLEPPDEELVPLDVLLGDPENAPLVSTLDDYEQRVDQFTRNVEYLRGFADGRSIWYWTVDGANSTLIANAFLIVDANQNRQQTPIIDVIPGDPGYTPWWRMVEYEVTSQWNGEVFTSRAAVDAGARAGLLDGPRATERILNAPVAVANVRASDGERVAVRTSTVWYRGTRAHWIAFNQNQQLEVGVREMPMLPVYVFQRIQQPLPLYEHATGVDITNDGRLNDSNNIFAADIDSMYYTPLWYRANVRTTQDYVSVDTAPPSRDVGLSAESEFFDRATGEILSPSVLDVEMVPGTMVNCPIQSARGQFP